MLRPLQSLTVAISVLAAAPTAAAQTFAAGNGNWSSASTWTNGVPVANQIVQIGTTFSGGAATASVFLSQNTSAGQLTLGQNGGTSGTLDLGNFNLTLNSLSFGNGGAASIVRGTGVIAVGPLTVGFGNFAYAPGDVSSVLQVINGGVTATTAATGNVTNSINIDQGTLNLGANMTLSSGIIANGGTINLQGRNVSAGASITLGQAGASTQFLNDGALSANSFSLSSASNVTLAGGNDTFGSLGIVGGSTLRVTDTAGQATGLTVESSNVSNLGIAAGSRLRLDLVNEAGWIFRWRNPTDGNHVADLNALIASARIDFVNPGSHPVFVTSDTDYTYISVIPVPEPALALLGLPVAAWLSRRRRTRPA